MPETIRLYDRMRNTVRTYREKVYKNSFKDLKYNGTPRFLAVDSDFVAPAEGEASIETHSAPVKKKPGRVVPVEEAVDAMQPKEGESKTDYMLRVREAHLSKH